MRIPTTTGTWETANPGRHWAHGDPPRWPDDYPDNCDCNPPAHTAAQINADESFHSRTCPANPSKRT